MTEARAHVRVEDRDVGRRIILDRPERRNALSTDMVIELADAVEEADAAGARSLVIAAAGPVFCAGGDLDSLMAVVEQGPVATTDIVYGAFHRLVRSIRTTSLPVIAAVNGPAIGAGMDLALVCDLRVLADQASLASSWVDVGLIPGMGGARYLPALVGDARAAELLLTGRSLGAEEALTWGLANAVVPASELLAKADEYAADIAGRPARAVTQTKAALRRASDRGLDDELQLLGASQAILLAGNDFREAMALRRLRARDRSD